MSHEATTVMISQGDQNTCPNPISLTFVQMMDSILSLNGSREKEEEALDPRDWYHCLSSVRISDQSDLDKYPSLSVASFRREPVFRCSQLQNFPRRIQFRGLWACPGGSSKIMKKFILAHITQNQNNSVDFTGWRFAVQTMRPGMPTVV